MRLYASLAAAGLLALAACTAAPPANDDGAAATDSDLSAVDFDTAASKLGSLPYLPWKYTTDGCYARALYYSMLLAEAGIPTKHVYVDMKPGTQPLYGIWGWHVAPIATKNGENQLYVFDPALFPDRVPTVREWVAIQGYDDPTSSDYPNLSIADGTSYAQSVGSTPLPNAVSPSAELYGEPTFAAMPKFTVGSINAACDVMHSYIELEPNSTAASKFNKHKGLADATVRLATSLQAKDKLSGAPSQISGSCTVPSQLDTTTCAADSATVKPSRPACCVASAHWCWSDNANNGAGDCVAEGTVEGQAVCTANQWVVAQK
jgi:hypothetical protein